MFCLFYDANSRSVHALNGSGRSGSRVTLDLVRKELGLSDGQTGSMPMGCVHAVTVPGAAAGWVDCAEQFGSRKLTLSDILAPAISLAEEGFPVSEFSAAYVCTTTIVLIKKISDIRYNFRFSTPEVKIL